MTVHQNPSTDTTKPLSTVEQTGEQTVIISSFQLDNRLEKTHAFDRVSRSEYYRKIRKIREHPTIKLATRMMIAPATRSGWTIQANEFANVDVTDDHIDYIKRQILPMQFHLIRNAIEQCLIWGWAPYEKVFGLDTEGKLKIKKLKPLLTDYTIILATEKGAFNGFKQEQNEQVRFGPNVEVILPVQDSLLINFDVEGTNWYGRSTAGELETFFDASVTTENAAQRFDQKHAGSHLVIKYPVGTSKINGTETPNERICEMIHSQIKAGGGLSIPQDLRGVIKELKEQKAAWDVQLLSASGTTSAQYIERAKYLDTLFVRGFGFPERTFLEGRFGTKADAEAQGEFGLTNIEDRFKEITLPINWHLINQLMVFQFGPEFENSIEAVPNPIIDSDRAFFITLYQQLLTQSEVLRLELDNIDLDAIRDKVGVPTREGGDTDNIVDILRDVAAPPLPEAPTNGNRIPEFTEVR